MSRPTLLTLLLALATHAAAQTPPLHTFSGGAAAERLGFSVAILRDVDGDGHPDLALGSPFDPAGSVQVGTANVRSGATGAHLIQIPGDAALDHMGWAVASAGDLDGDGRGDVLAGAPESDLAFPDGGLVRAVSGASGAVLWTWTGVQAGERFGCALAGGADADGDGVPDVLAGAYLAANGGAAAGRYRLRSGATGALLGAGAGAPGDQLGTSVAFAGDLDGDGCADLLVGADQAASDGPGYVLVVSGRTGAVLRLLSGDAAGDRFGTSVCAAGDVDGDLVPDIAVGAPRALVAGLRRGAVRVHSGATGALLARFEGEALNEGFGTSVAPAGDADGDGRSDLWIGAPFAGGSGRVLLVSPSTQSVLRVHAGAQGGSRFGWSVSGGADVDLDGSPDLLVGAPYEDAPLTDCGVARLLSGTDCTGQTYCTAQVNSLGCTPAIAVRGTLSLSGGSALSLQASGILSGQPGVFLLGLASASIPFQGGTLCVQPPVVRSPLLPAGGAPGSCGGTLSWSLTPAFASANGWTAGTWIHAQLWSRDPGAPSGTNLTDAARARVCP